MPTFISAADRKALFTRIYHRLGAPIRQIELTDEQLDSLLLDAIDDYSKFINEWLIEQQWGSLSGLQIDNADISFGFMTKSLDFQRSFSYAYSKQVGLGTNAPAGDSWELKKDYVELKNGVQTYLIPSGREVNEVLWFTPPFIGRGYDPLDTGVSAWIGGNNGWTIAGQSAGYVQPMFNALLVAQDKTMRNRIINSEMSYRITGLATGEKLLHLYGVPGGRFAPAANSTLPRDVDGVKVWYWYYEVNNKNKNKCKKNNPDVVKTFNDVPVDNLSWNDLNEPSKTWVRNYLLALAKGTLGKVRGKYSGVLNVTDVSLTMDYADLLSESIEEISNLKDDIKDRLDKLTYVNVLERQANEAKYLNDILSYIPLMPQIH